MTGFTTEKHKDNHSLSIKSIDGYFIYITFLINDKGAPKSFREYKITHPDGLIKYMDIDEIRSSQSLKPFIKEIYSLTKKVKDKDVILLQNGNLFVK